MVSIGREAVSEYLGDNRGASLYGALIVFQNYSGCSAGRNKAVSVAVERTGCLFRLALPLGESSDTVEAANGERVDFLRSAADYHILKTVLDEHTSPANGVASAGAGPGNRKVYSLELEDAGEIHRDGGVHALEDASAADQGGVSLLPHGIHAGYNRFCAGVVSVEKAHFVAVQILLVYAGVP